MGALYWSIVAGARYVYYLDEFNKLTMDLKNVDKIFDDEERGIMLLTYLLESWERFTDQLL